MRAKFRLDSVTPLEFTPPSEDLVFTAVTEAAFDQDGNSEDNDFSKWTPTGVLTMRVTNPALLGTFKPGTKYYLDFTEAQA